MRNERKDRKRKVRERKLIMINELEKNKEE